MRVLHSLVHSALFSDIMCQDLWLSPKQCRDSKYTEACLTLKQKCHAPCSPRSSLLTHKQPAHPQAACSPTSRLLRAAVGLEPFSVCFNALTDNIRIDTQHGLSSSPVQELCICSVVLHDGGKRERLQHVECAVHGLPLQRQAVIICSIALHDGGKRERLQHVECAAHGLPLQRRTTISNSIFQFNNPLSNSKSSPNCGELCLVKVSHCFYFPAPPFHVYGHSSRGCQHVRAYCTSLATKGDFPPFMFMATFHVDASM
jgi:hypothetical protein